MPNVQPTYNQALSAALAGQRANMEPARVISRTVQPAGGMTFGVVAVQGTTDTTITNVSGGALKYVGITLIDTTVRPLTANAYSQNDTAEVMVKGVVWVTVAANVSPRDPVYFDTSGNITNVSTSNTLIPNASFDSTGTSGGLAQLRLS